MILRFSPAYFHRPEGIPGVNRGTYWKQAANSTFKTFQISGSIPQLPCRVFDGAIILGDNRHDNLLPVSTDYTSNVDANLIFEDGTEIRVNAERLELTLIANPVFVEDFPGE